MVVMMALVVMVMFMVMIMVVVLMLMLMFMLMFVFVLVPVMMALAIVMMMVFVYHGIHCFLVQRYHVPHATGLQTAEPVHCSTFCLSQHVSTDTIGFNCRLPRAGAWPQHHH